MTAHILIVDDDPAISELLEFVLASPGREITVAAFPIGIDVDHVIRMAEKSVTGATVGRTLDGLAGRELVLGVDRLDYSKGLPERFRAFEELLVRYPETRSRLVYMQFAPPTRTGVRAYQDIREELERSAGHINGGYAEPDWVPIRYLNKGFSRSMLMGLFRAAQIALVTPLRDGNAVPRSDTHGRQHARRDGGPQEPRRVEHGVVGVAAAAAARLLQRR